MNKFSTLPLKSEMLKNIETIGYKEMTPIQEEALPYILKGKDIIAKAKTGSGKTATFGIGLLSKLKVKEYEVQSLIICPTRELADQVAKEIRRLAKFTHNIKVLTLSGGMPFRPQLNSLRHNAHIIVGTAGRILKHLRKGSLKLNGVNTLVLDEADKMLDMGFYDDIMDIIKTLPKNRQTLLFSATYPETIVQMSREIQIEPIEISVEAVHKEDVIKQIFYKSNRGDKFETLSLLLKHYQPKSTIIFCNTKDECKSLTIELQDRGFDALELHGDLEQIDRKEILIQFTNESCSILVATDVASRGLDIKDLEAVINYDLAHEVETHFHRIGRTARAGEKGLALSIYSESEEFKLEEIREYQESEIIYGESSELIDNNSTFEAPMVTLCIEGGKKVKLRAGDILGVLTKSIGILGEQVGKIDIDDRYSFVAIKKEVVDKAFSGLKRENIKNKSFRVWRLD